MLKVARITTLVRKRGVVSWSQVKFPASAEILSDIYVSLGVSESRSLAYTQVPGYISCTMAAVSPLSYKLKVLYCTYTPTCANFSFSFLFYLKTVTVF